MLNKRERFKVLKFIRICCNLGLFPLQVDLKNWQLKLHSTIRQWICSLSYCCFLLHVMYKSARLVYTYLFMPAAQLHTLIIHIIIVIGTTMAAYWYHVLYIRSPALFAKFVEMTLLGNVGGPDLDPCDESNKQWRSRLREYTLQDLIATSSPYLVVACVAMVIATYVYDPSMRFLLFAVLPSDLQNWATFGLCLLEEIRLLVIAVSVAVPIWQLQVISFGLVTNKLQFFMRTIQNGAQIPRTVYRFLRYLQVYVSIFNKINSDVIFTCKLCCISISIISGYAAIAHFREHPVFGTMYYALLFDATLIYSIIYEKAFMIPQLFDRTVGRAMVHMHGNRARLFGKQMRSMPPIGVKVGNFHRMERASTLIFIHFVVGNIVNMLVAYG